MKSGYFSMVLLSIILLTIPAVSVYGSKYNLHYSQVSPISAEVPKVILQQGTAGTSTIYTNSTSAKVSVSASADTEYGRAFKASDVRVSTTSGTPVDDSESALSLTLAKDSSIFIIYNAESKVDSTEDYRGKGCAISVDETDVAFSWQSARSSNKANSVTVAYATNLTAGSHVIKGRFFANSAGATVGIDTRQIAAFWFSNITAKYVRSTTVSATTSGTPIDDLQASLTFELNCDSVAFVIYNVGNKHGSTEIASGKGITIKVDGTDIATRQWQSPYNSNYANSITITYAVSLGIGSHTVIGRVFSNTAGKKVTIDERQLIVFNFPADEIMYGFVQSATSVYTDSTTPVDDTEAILTKTLTQDTDSLMMYVGGNPNDGMEGADGKGIKLQIDGTDKSNSTSRQSCGLTGYADSCTSLWCEELAAGSHTVKGRFFANVAASVSISNRQLLLLALLKSQATTHDYVLKVVNGVEENWKIRLRAYNQSIIERLSNCTIYFDNGGGVSREVYIYNGAYSQQFGDWYDLISMSTVYIVMTVSTNSTGTSHVYAYLEVLIPSISTYNLIVITFEIS